MWSIFLLQRSKSVGGIRLTRVCLQCWLYWSPRWWRIELCLRTLTARCALLQLCVQLFLVSSRILAIYIFLPQEFFSLGQSHCILGWGEPRQLRHLLECWRLDLQLWSFPHCMVCDIICDTGWYGIQGKIEIEKKDIHDEGSLQRMMKEREIDGALYCDDLSQNVFLKMYLSQCISHNVFLKTNDEGKGNRWCALLWRPFSKCISQNIFLKMYFSKCISQNEWWRKGK